MAKLKPGARVTHGDSLSRGFVEPFDFKTISDFYRL